MGQLGGALVRLASGADAPLLTVQPRAQHLRRWCPSAGVPAGRARGGRRRRPASSTRRSARTGWSRWRRAHWSEQGGGRRPGRAPRGGQPVAVAEPASQLTDPVDGRRLVLALCGSWRPDGSCTCLAGRRQGRPAAGLPCVTWARWRPGPRLLERPGPACQLSRQPASRGVQPTSRRSAAYRPETPLLPATGCRGWVAGLPADRPSSCQPGDGLPRRSRAPGGHPGGVAEVEPRRRRGRRATPDRCPPAAHVRVEARIPQALLLESCDLLVTTAALCARGAFLGVPMVWPPSSATSCTTPGAGEAPGHRAGHWARATSPPGGAAACGECLGDPLPRAGPRAAARRARPAAARRAGPRRRIARGGG